jgi:hypothetical protein
MGPTAIGKFILASIVPDDARRTLQNSTSWR